jgi:hypothetical protein
LPALLVFSVVPALSALPVLPVLPVLPLSTVVTGASVLPPFSASSLGTGAEVGVSSR